MNRKMNVKKGDRVVVLSGKDKGKKGKVLTVFPDDSKVIIEGVNMATKHTKARKQGQTGGIIHQEVAIRCSKVMNVCKSCGQPTRLAHFITENGDKLRMCKKCKETMED